MPWVALCAVPLYLLQKNRLFLKAEQFALLCHSSLPCYTIKACLVIQQPFALHLLQIHEYHPTDKPFHPAHATQR